jgi:hypothetical protein
MDVEVLCKARWIIVLPHCAPTHAVPTGLLP